MERILVKHADWLVSMDAAWRIYTDGAVAIEGDRIVAAGKTSDVARNFTATKEIDATGKLVMPGLIDTHVHNVQQLGRGVAEGCEMKVHLLERLLNPLTNLVHSARGGADTVLCNGRILMENGVVLTIDEREVLKEAQERGERLAARAGLLERIRPKWPIH
ncbi:MAG: imidazolonepropionase-like domain-containing protein [Burkholderiales bacterium]